MDSELRSLPANEAAFNLRYYAEARDLDYLLDRLEDEPGRSGHANEKMGRLNRAMVELLDDYGNVSFETLAVEVS